MQAKGRVMANEERIVGSHLDGVFRSQDRYSQAKMATDSKDAPTPRVVHIVGVISPTLILAGLHHRYVRI